MPACDPAGPCHPPAAATKPPITPPAMAPALTPPEEVLAGGGGGIGRGGGGGGCRRGTGDRGRGGGGESLTPGPGAGAKPSLSCLGKISMLVSSAYNWRSSTPALEGSTRHASDMWTLHNRKGHAQRVGPASRVRFTWAVLHALCTPKAVAMLRRCTASSQSGVMGCKTRHARTQYLPPPPGWCHQHQPPLLQWQLQWCTRSPAAGTQLKNQYFVHSECSIQQFRCCGMPAQQRAGAPAPRSARPAPPAARGVARTASKPCLQL